MQLFPKPLLFKMRLYKIIFEFDYRYLKSLQTTPFFIQAFTDPEIVFVNIWNNVGGELKLEGTESFNINN